MLVQSLDEMLHVQKLVTKQGTRQPTSEPIEVLAPRCGVQYTGIIVLIHKHRTTMIVPRAHCENLAAL